MLALRPAAPCPARAHPPDIAGALKSDRRGPARGRVFWRSRSVDSKRVLHPDEEPQLARPPHHRLPDEAVYEFPPNRDADRCRGQSRVQRRHRLSHRTGSSAAVAKESAARPPTARSLLDLVGRPRSLISGGLARAGARTRGRRGSVGSCRSPPSYWQTKVSGGACSRSWTMKTCRR